MAGRIDGKETGKGRSRGLLHSFNPRRSSSMGRYAGCNCLNGVETWDVLQGGKGICGNNVDRVVGENIFDMEQTALSLQPMTF